MTFQLSQTHPLMNISRLQRRLLSSTVMLMLLVSGFVPRAGAEAPPEYSRDVRPILAKHCFACHGADSGTRKAGLRLDQREEAVDFGAILPGEPEFSEMMVRVLSDDPEMVMPPPSTKETLSEEDRDVLQRWIAAGAEYQDHWSFIPPEKTAPPEVRESDWVKNPIDRFVLAKLDELDLEPASEADPRTLFRRVHFDITGLPPAPEEVEAFVEDYQEQPEATLSDWIDRLMDRPGWGEHRARYWLDAARYADTHGMHFDNYREMWPYRDWVIRAFNENQPFDQFTIEQLAGDLLPDPGDDQLIATGFQRCNTTTNEGGTIDEENLALYAADRVQTFGWVYLGLTTNCSQCHDHKFDPISTQDYYSLAAYFRNTTQGAKDGNVKDGLGPALVVPSEQDRPRWDALPDEITNAKQQRDEYKEQARPAWKSWLTTFSAESLEERLPAEELIAHLPLNEGEGDEVESRGQGPASFRATGEVTWNEDGKLGPAPVIRSGNTFDLGDLGDFEKDEAFSYGAWVKTAKNDTSAGIIARMDEQASHRGWDLWQNGKSFSVHLIDSWPDNAIKVTTQAAVVEPGKWQHVLATYDGSGKPAGVKIFVDGEEQPLKVDQESLQDDASFQTETPLRIGQRSEGAVFEGGAVQDVRIYARTLTPQDVQAIADSGPLREILAIDDQERTPEQQTALFEHYLNLHDPEYPGLAQAVTDLEAELEAIRERSPVTHIQEEKPDSPPTTHILIRGEYDQPGEEVTAAPPAALHPLAEDAPNNRLGLAQWLVDPANPLTSRVTVNRFWQQLFGRGLVETTEDFGVMGTSPTHPELLDWLAIEFQEDGWDVKRFFKLMLTSATYRQAAIATPEKLEYDHDNAWLSRGPRFRMDAEMVRDAALASSGLLSSKMFGPSVKPYQPNAIWDVVGLPGGNTRDYEQDDGEGLYRRTVYSFWKRMAPPPNLEAFNAPSREVCTVRRERTNTPLQALVMLNDPQFVEAARNLAERVLRDHEGDDDAAVVDQIARHALSRPMNDREQAVLLEDLRAFHDHYESHPDDAEALLAVGQSQVADSIAAPRLAAWTMVCNQVLNLDETISK